MDPRFRRRRIDVRRDEGRRRLRILLGCLGVVAAAGGAAGAGRSPLFDVDRTDVRGAERTPADEVVRAAGLSGHPAMLDVDSGRIARSVEALPWVLEATAHREWPGTVRVDITERRPAAVLPAAGQAWALADRTGRILEIGSEKPAGLPVIGNIPPPTKAGASVPAAATPSLRVAAALPAPVRERVADVATLETGEVELQLTPPGGVVRLGPPVDLETKLSVLATVLARADLARVRVVDVRVPRAPSLTRR
ncbi:MAG TPA: FtsQ-type POTRA domain-containing protein [Acidimicrobiales bacterium]|nr:FtsQ-type POTRA domain-containing protein [Acidimicrobiales bacterium]